MSDALKELIPMHVSFLADYPDFFSFSMVMLLTALLAFGVKESSIINNIFTCINLVTVGIVIVSGALKADPANRSLTDVPADAGAGGSILWHNGRYGRGS